MTREIWPLAFLTTLRKRFASVSLWMVFVVSRSPPSWVQPSSSSLPNNSTNANLSIGGRKLHQSEWPGATIGPSAWTMKGLLWTLRGTGEFIYLLLPHFRSQDNQNYLDWLHFLNIKSGFQLLLETPLGTESLTGGILYFTSLNNCLHFLLINYSRIKRLVNRDENKHILFPMF